MDPRAHPRLSWLHRWLGVALGSWFALVGLTGALLVWRDEIDALLNPTLFTPRSPAATAAAAAAPPLGFSGIAARVREQGLGRIERLRPPAFDRRAAPGGDGGLRVWRVQVRAAPSRVESGRLEAFLDPADGTLLGVRSLEPVSLAPPHALRTLYEFHRNVLLGEPGSNLVGIAGFALMASALSGALIAWPRTRARLRRLLAVSWRANGTRVLLDLHRSTGVLIVVLLLLTTLTGATLVYLNVVRDAVGRLSRVEPIPILPFRPAAETEEPLSLDALAARATAAFPGRRIAELRLPERSLTGVLVQLHAPGDVHRLGDTIVWLHPVSGEVLAERSPRTRSAGEAFMHWLLPLHVGSAFGTPGLIAMCAAGLAPLLLVTSGLVIWWRKRPGERLAGHRARERARERERERPPERSSRRG